MKREPLTSAGYSVIDRPNRQHIQLIALKGGLKLEIAGMRRSRGPSCYSILKGLGYKGSRQEILEMVTRDVELILTHREAHNG